jgi:dihydropteroate synthase
MTDPAVPPAGPRAGSARPVGLPESLAGLGRTAVMGICNVTPDSFSDGGSYLEAQAAIDHGLDLIRRGADLVDVGGESTRPGAERIDESVELDRVLPVIAGLAGHGVAVSIDTTRSGVARQAVEAGAVIVNDVSGGLADPAMLPEVARLGVPYILSHWRGHSATMDRLDSYRDVVQEVRDELGQRLGAAVEAGVGPARIVLDPGLGFAKAGANNVPLLAHLEVLQGLGHPVLIGASRKRFLAEALGPGADGSPRPPRDRDAATAAVTALVAALGVWAVRVHEPAANADAVRIAHSWRAATG